MKQPPQVGALAGAPAPPRDRSALRRSPFNRTWSIVAQRRSERPLRHAVRAGGNSASRCPFCEGNEHDTEPEVFAVRDPGSGADARGWRVRVVPNKFPALTREAETVDGLGNPFLQISAQGLHEVIVDSPEHVCPLHRFSDSQLETVLGVYRSRLEMLAREPWVRSVAIFRNEGPGAGASQEHPHSQLLALPIVPARLRAELAGAVRHLRRHGECLTCRMAALELQRGERVILQNADFVAVAGFAPRFPYETWILPRSHQHDYAAVSPGQIRSLATMLKQVLRALETAAGPLAFNLVMQTAPTGLSGRHEPAFHWRFEILPRLTVPSGLEIGCGVSIVALSPEAAARRLRSTFS